MNDTSYSLFIDGRWIESSDGQYFDVIEAATEKSLGSVSAAGLKEVDSAVLAARRALRGEWGATTAIERAETIERFASALRSRRKETASTVSQENGMPISLSGVVNGMAPAQIMSYYAQLVRESPAEEARAGMSGPTVVRQEPIGVVAAIVPWNYPQALAAMKLAPALAAGCTVVLKTSPETALDARAFGEAAEESGLPSGVLNILPGGREIGEALVAHSEVDKVAFTGSTVAGRAIAETCGRMLRPVTLELGGKSAAIVTEDADLQDFTANLPAISFPNNGQTCYASTRVLAPKSRYEEVVEAVTSVAQNLVIGDPLDRETAIGPLVTAAQQRNVLQHIESGRASGARLTTGGGIPPKHAQGWFVQPTVFADVDNRTSLAQEEIFGPVLCVLPYAGVDQAVEIANDSMYGLAGTVWTSDDEQGIDIARGVQTGTIGINTYGLDVNAPFGGVKASGLGRELGREGIEPYLLSKSIYTKASQ